MLAGQREPAKPSRRGPFACEELSDYEFIGCQVANVVGKRLLEIERYEQAAEIFNVSCSLMHAYLDAFLSLCSNVFCVAADLLLLLL